MPYLELLRPGQGFSKISQRKGIWYDRCEEVMRCMERHPRAVCWII